MRHFKLPIFTLALVLLVFLFSATTAGNQLADVNEPNDARDSATEVQLPYVGQSLAINPSGDRDVYQFSLSESSQVEIAIFADHVGSTLDPVMTLFDENEEILSQSDDVVGLDPLIRAQLGAGTYFVVVEGFADLSIGFYEIEIFSQSLGDCIDDELQANETRSWSLGVIQSGSRIQLALMGPAEADFDLALFEVISDAPPVSVPVDISLSTTSQERVSYRVDGAGAREFIAQVNAFTGSGSYMLCFSISPPREGSE